MQELDLTLPLQKSVLEAAENKKALQIVGGNSKLFYGREPKGQVLSLSQHQGVINYHPSELVITARTGTPLAVIEQVLAEQGQMLAFEPPHFAGSATLGGTIACGLSGPRRPFSGSVRDFVLGCKMINGKGEVLSFGGEVMKNVAGYDVSRLMVGALGTLGVLLEVSLKVLPLPVYESTLLFEVKRAEAFKMLTDLAAKSLPVSGLCYDGSVVYVRLSGFEQSVLSTEEKLGGSALYGKSDFWQDLRELKLDFFQRNKDLWRLSLAPAVPELNLQGDWFYDWGGAQRWLTTDESAESIFAAAQDAEGHASLFRGLDRSGEVFQPLPEKLRQLNFNLKQAFDPVGIFNPNRINRAW